MNYLWFANVKVAHRAHSCVVIVTGECIGALTAHQDAVSSISIDASGLYLATGGTCTTPHTTSACV